jgi:hypothetical protein
MTAGLDWDESTFPHPDERNPNTKMYQVDDPMCPFGRRALVKFFRDGLIGLHIGSGLRTRRKA